MIWDILIFACMHACLITSVVSDSAILWTVNCQPPLSMEFSRQGYWNGLPLSPPGDLPNSGIEPECPAPPALQADSLPLNQWGGPYSSLLDIPVHYREAQATEPVAGVIRASQMVQVVKTKQNKTKKPACNEGDTGYENSIPELGISPGEGNGNPFQYSCLENSMDRGAYWAVVHRITKSQTVLSERERERENAIGTW